MQLKIFTMKSTVFFTALIFLACAGFSSEKVKSKVYSFSDTKTENTISGEKKVMIAGETVHLENFEIQTNTLEPGKTFHEKLVQINAEQIVFVKEGKIEVSVKNALKNLGSGSVALIMPGDEFTITNAGEKQATWYLIRYKSKEKMDSNRGKMAGGSMLIDWEGLNFQTHERGGVRKFFDRKSAMSERIEMHATTLNPGINSHDPHTHEPAEIVIMMEGTTEMEIDGNHYPGKAGDVYFLGSNSSHAIRNTGTKPCMYLAFQWE